MAQSPKHSARRSSINGPHTPQLGRANRHAAGICIFTAQVNSGTAQVGSGWLRLCSGQGANGSRSKPKKEIDRGSFGDLIRLHLVQYLTRHRLVINKPNPFSRHHSLAAFVKSKQLKTILNYYIHLLHYYLYIRFSHATSSQWIW
jgi:hypothetical protein